MRTTGMLIGLMWSLVACQGANEPETIYDVHIHGGLVFDGVSLEGRSADVFLHDDRVVFVGDGEREKLAGEKTIDATGLIVAPGFIDPHTHTTSDVLFGTDSKALPGYLTQGVTTVVPE